MDILTGRYIKGRENLNYNSQVPNTNSNSKFKKHFRIRIETTPTTCGVRIDRAEPRDHGEWKCIMRDNPLNNVGAQS